MEAVHKPENRTWIDHEIINIRRFLEDWKSALHFKMFESENVNTFIESLVSDKDYQDITEECGLAALRCQYQDTVEPSNQISIPAGVDLKTIRFQSEDLTKRKIDQKYCSALYYFLKTTNYPPHKLFSSQTDVSRIPVKSVVTPEVVLSVQIFLPERKPNSKLTQGYVKMATFTLDVEFLVLGCQLLTELRDKIDCVSDKAIPGEFSECPDSIENAITCKEIYKSGYFYINGVFYNDMRDKDCRDYSETIIKWAANSKREIGPFKSAAMEDTRFIDLDIQLGYPYVYVHQGECEHLIVFSDLRLFSEHDFDNRNAYPLYVQAKPSKRIFCMICHVYTSVWIVYDNKRLPENPYFFCKKCFKNFNYDENNQKIGNFRAYHFPDHSKMF